MTIEKKPKNRGTKKGAFNNGVRIFHRYVKIGRDLGMIKKNPTKNGFGKSKDAVDKLKKYVLRENITIEELEVRHSEGKLECYREDVRSHGFSAETQLLKKVMQPDRSAKAIKTADATLELFENFDIKSKKERAAILKATALCAFTERLNPSSAAVIVGIIKEANKMYEEETADVLSTIVTHHIVTTRDEAERYRILEDNDESEDIIDVESDLTDNWNDEL